LHGKGKTKKKKKRRGNLYSAICLVKNQASKHLAMHSCNVKETKDLVMMLANKKFAFWDRSNLSKNGHKMAKVEEKGGDGSAGTVLCENLKNLEVPSTHL